MQLHSIETGYFKLDGGAMFGVVPKTLWNKQHEADAQNRIQMSMRCLLIEDGNRLTLVDTGIGEKQDPKFFSHYDLNGSDTLKQSLKATGFAPTDVTDVVLTHLHFDHCGGAIERAGEGFRTAFPKATYWSNADHWDWAVNPNEREKASFLKENILPIQESGQLKFIDVTETHQGQLGKTDLFPNLSVRFVNGHTDKMMLPQIEYQGRTLVFCADLFPFAAHLPLPWVMAYDMFPLTTLHEKKMFLNEAVEKDYVLFFEHDALHECATLERTEKGVRIKETFTLSELR